jgi:aconitate hydratase 2/2-methylisocitrate dehydratase
VKASYLAALASGEEAPSLEGLDKARAIELLGTMQGGYNVAPLIGALQDEDEAIASSAAKQLKNTLLVFDAFYEIEEVRMDNDGQ